MDARLVRQWVPDGLGVVAEPLIPLQQIRPQGAATAMANPRAVLAAIVFVLRTGCAWRHLPPGFGVATATAHRRFAGWTRAGQRRRHRAVLAPLGARAEVDWSRALVDAAAVRAKRGDRGPVRTRPTAARQGRHCPC